MRQIVRFSILISILFISFDSWSQLTSQNLLINPGAEQGLDGWILTTDVQAVSELYQFYPYEEMNFFTFNTRGRFYQDIQLDLPDFPVQSGAITAKVSLFLSSYFLAIIPLRLNMQFFDVDQKQIGQFVQDLPINQIRIWKRFEYETLIPEGTSFIRCMFIDDSAVFCLDAMSLTLYNPNVAPPPTATATPNPTTTPNVIPTNTPTLTPTFTPTLPPGATPTPTRKPFAIVPAKTFKFGGASAGENGFIAVAPGAPGDYSLGDVYFRLFSAKTGGGVDTSGVYSDGFGMSCALDSKEGVLLYGAQPITGQGDYIYMRLAIWSNDSRLALALGALDAKQASDIGGAELDGSLGLTQLFQSSRFNGQFGYLEAFFKAEREAIVPIVQVVNNSTDTQATIVQFDNLEVYRIPADMIPTFIQTP